MHVAIGASDKSETSHKPAKPWSGAGAAREARGGGGGQADGAAAMTAEVNNRLGSLAANQPDIGDGATLGVTEGAGAGLLRNQQVDVLSALALKEFHGVFTADGEYGEMLQRIGGYLLHKARFGYLLVLNLGL